MKSRKLLLGVGMTLVVGLMIGSLLAAKTHTAEARAPGCDGKGITRQISIKADRVSPEITDGNVCDTIQLTNQDNVTREISFGGHEQHTAYNGVTEKILNQNQSFTVVLNKTGQYHFHDHNHDEVMGYFNVSE